MRLTVGLSRESVREAREAVERHAATFPRRVDRLCRALAETGVEVAVRTVPVRYGDLRAGIRLESRGRSSWLVVADNDHAAFVEFGTGVVGQGPYRGGLPDGWGYDLRRTPEAHDPEDPTLWYYRDPKDGKVHRTRGQMASHYMLRASEAMRADVLRRAKEAWK